MSIGRPATEEPTASDSFTAFVVTHEAQLRHALNAALGSELGPRTALAEVTRQPGLAVGLPNEELGEGSPAHFEIARFSRPQILDDSHRDPLIGPILQICARVRGGFPQMDSGW